MSGLLNPNEVVKKLPVIPSMVIADFGAGSGFFSIALAKALNNNGKVIALDIWPKALEALQTRAKIEKVWPVIETKIADLEKPNGSKLTSESVNMVLISNMLFQTENKINILKEAKRILQKDGFLVIIDWDPQKLPNKENLFPIDKDKINKTILDMGFKFKEDIFISDTHYCLIYIKN